MTGCPGTGSLDFIAAGGVTFESAAAERQAAISDQFRETPMYAASLERKANAWLGAANASDVADRWSKFDEFLASLSLAIVEEGYGLTRGLTVVDIPVGAAAESKPAHVGHARVLRYCLTVQAVG
jgi:hypothetical protein